MNEQHYRAKKSKEKTYIHIIKYFYCDLWNKHFAGNRQQQQQQQKNLVEQNQFILN
jgi:hypothetical protein